MFRDLSFLFEILATVEFFLEIKILRFLIYRTTFSNILFYLCQTAFFFFFIVFKSRGISNARRETFFIVPLFPCDKLPYTYLSSIYYRQISIFSLSFLLLHLLFFHNLSLLNYFLLLTSYHLNILVLRRDLSIMHFFSSIS